MFVRVRNASMSEHIRSIQDNNSNGALFGLPVAVLGWDWLASWLIGRYDWFRCTNHHKGSIVQQNS